MLQKHYRWIIPLVCFMILAPFTPYLDQAISRQFFQDGYFPGNAFATFFFKYGFIPANVLSAIALVFYLGGFFLKSLKPFQAPAALFVFTVIIGSGIITHLILKDHWGRPRPAQVIEFGGKQQFRPFYEPNFKNPIPSKSFPCGHCTAGFCYLAIILIGQRHHNKIIYWLGVLLTLFFVGALSYTRLVQGGHFLTDVLAAGLVMWLTTLFLEWLIYDKIFYPTLNK